jgi:hypothetical protein
MSDVTSTAVETLQAALDRADPNKLADALRKVKLGSMLSPLKVTFASMTSVAEQNITSAANFAAATINQGSAAYTRNLPPILAIDSMRVTAGTAATGERTIGDSGATTSTTVAKLSDDGTTLTCEAAYTGMVLEYIPRSAVDPSGAFNGS